MWQEGAVCYDAAPSGAVINLLDGHMPIEETMGRLLANARISAGLSVEQLAKKTQLKLDQLVSYEAGEKRIPPPHLTRLALTLKISLSELLPSPIPLPPPKERARRRVRKPQTELSK